MTDPIIGVRKAAEEFKVMLAAITTALDRVDDAGRAKEVDKAAKALTDFTALVRVGPGETDEDRKELIKIIRAAREKIRDDAIAAEIRALDEETDRLVDIIARLNAEATSNLERARRLAPFVELADTASEIMQEATAAFAALSADDPEEVGVRSKVKKLKTAAAAVVAAMDGLRRTPGST